MVGRALNRALLQVDGLEAHLEREASLVGAHQGDHPCRWGCTVHEGDTLRLRRSGPRREVGDDTEGDEGSHDDGRSFGDSRFTLAKKHRAAREASPAKAHVTGGRGVDGRRAERLGPSR